MTEVASRDLRNHTADVLERAAGGEEIIITVHGRPVAQLVPIDADHRRPMPRAKFIEFLESGGQADPGLRDELAALAGDTTDDLGPIW